MRPATIVGSANGRSMTALTAALPRKRSRTSTHAISVPKTALIAAVASEIEQREAEGADRLPRRHRVPERVEAAVERVLDDGGQRQQDDEAEPQQRHAHRQPPAREAGAGAPPPDGERDAHEAVDTPASSSILATEPFSGSNISSFTFDQPPRSSIVKRPEGSGNFDLLASKTSSLTGR